MYPVAENAVLNKTDGTKIKLKEGISFSSVMDFYAGAAVIEFDENDYDYVLENSHNIDLTDLINQIKNAKIPNKS